jgi:hypothetical protein
MNIKSNQPPSSRFRRGSVLDVIQDAQLDLLQDQALNSRGRNNPLMNEYGQSMPSQLTLPSLKVPST